MTSTALITGASSGIGADIARYHASKKGDLVITARREPQLNALKEEIEAAHGVNVHVIVCDLGANGGPKKLYNAVKKLNVNIDILVNNAGFGGRGRHIEHELSLENAMIDLNVKALVELTHRFGNDMAKKGQGKILNVGSTVGFFPGPNQAIYFATKAFVNSFSQAIDQELRHHGVTSTLLAPGYVKTEFAKVAGLEGTQAVRSDGASSKDVAKCAYDAMIAGKLLVINETLLSFMINWIFPLLPRRMILKLVEKAQEK